MRQWFRIAFPRNYLDRRKRAGFLFVLPALLFFGSVFLLPLAQSILYSFYKIAPGGAREFVGLRLYEKVLTDSTFWTAVGNTVQLLLFSVPTTVVLALAVALGLNRISSLKWRNVWASMYFLPFATSLVAAALIWQWIYDPVYGFLNYALSFVGIPPQKWLQSLSQVLPVHRRRERLGADRLRHDDLPRRAAIDPARSITRRPTSTAPVPSQRLRYITLPLLNAQIIMVCILELIFNFKIFDQVYATTQGGPAGASQTIIMLLYDTAFKFFRFGDASVMAVFVFVTLMAGDVAAMATLPQAGRVLNEPPVFGRDELHRAIDRIAFPRALALRQVHVRWLIMLAVACGAIVVFFPFFWMAVTSLKTAPEIQRVPLQIAPDHWLNFSNYVEVFKREPFLRYLLNSAIVASIAAVSSVVVSSLAGFGFAKYRFPGRDVFFLAIVGILMVPFQSVVVPLYVWMNELGLLDTYAGIVAPDLVSVFGVFLMRQAIETIPNDYIDAARIDGASELRIFFLVILPSVKPAIATLLIIKFMWSWNEFFWPMVVISSPQMKVVTMGLMSFTNMYFIEYNLLTAAAVISILPILRHLRHAAALGGAGRRDERPEGLSAGPGRQAAGAAPCLTVPWAARRRSARNAAPCSGRGGARSARATPPRCT